MKIDEIKVGDKVKIIDGSYGVRMDKYEKYSGLGSGEDDFEVIYKDLSEIKDYFSIPIHNIHIKNLRTGSIYLHSAAFVSPVQRLKKMTIKEIEAKLGHKIEIIGDDND